MTVTWNTKWGKRQVRHEPPTLAEALAAAECFTDDVDHRIEIAATLMGVTLEEAKVEARKLAVERRNVVSVAAPMRERGARTVVVERKASRRMLPRDAAERAAALRPR